MFPCLRLCFPVSGAVASGRMVSWATRALLSESLSICQAIKADGERDDASELLEHIPPERPAGEMPGILK